MEITSGMNPDKDWGCRWSNIIHPLSSFIMVAVGDFWCIALLICYTTYFTKNVCLTICDADLLANILVRFRFDHPGMEAHNPLRLDGTHIPVKRSAQVEQLWVVHHIYPAVFTSHICEWGDTTDSVHRGIVWNPRFWHSGQPPPELLSYRFWGNLFGPRTLWLRLGGT